MNRSPLHRLEYTVFQAHVRNHVSCTESSRIKNAVRDTLLLIDSGFHHFNSGKARTV
jgi:hypothetical protein